MLLPGRMFVLQWLWNRMLFMPVLSLIITNKAARFTITSNTSVCTALSGSIRLCRANYSNLRNKTMYTVDPVFHPDLS